jgi:hypothetical protein
MTPAALRAVRSVAGVACGLAVAACSRDIPLGSDQAAVGAGTAGSTAGRGGQAGVGGEAGAGNPTCVPASCRGKTYACGNCKDDDGDGLIDALDPECTGPCDNLENSLDVGLPGSGSGSCDKDCFFDRGNGAGNDGCRFSSRCDPLSVAPDYPPSGDAACSYDEATKVPGGSGTCADLRATQAPACADVCGPLTPNGCDCFGCCELPAGGGAYLSLATGLACTPVDACLNRCDPCESCVGRPEPLPSCAGSGPACTTDYQPCDAAGVSLCRGTDYCITGCCIPQPR